MLFDEATDSTFQLCTAIESRCPPEVIQHHALEVLRRAYGHVVRAEVPLLGDWLAMSTLLVMAADMESEGSGT